MVLTSCSKVPIVKDIGIPDIFSEDGNPDEIVGKAVPKWFQGKDEFSLKQTFEDETVHMFYDMTPDIDMNNFSLNFIATTPAGSEFEYELDILSGQHYVNKTYCAQEDIWESYRELTYKPPYTLGVIPRLLDELGGPQKIMVFGDDSHIRENFKTNIFDAKIIGGFIEKTCLKGGCFRLEEWKKRVVLIGVQKDYKKYNSIDNLELLKKSIDWPKVKAFVENGQGINKIASTYYPAFRYGAEINKAQALKYIDKNSIYLKNKNLLGIRKSCHKLYNKVWNEVGKDSKFETEIKKIKSLEERRTYLKKNKINKRSLFHHRFKNAFIKYGKSYKTCFRYIYPSNINHDSTRHWFFSYYSAVHLLHELGYSFDCSRGIWAKNPLLSSGKRQTRLKDEFKGCSAKKVDRAFEQSISFLNLLRKKKLYSYRYVDYDKGSFGTHRKIYSWLKVDNKHFQCKKRIRPDISKRFRAFPEDVNWRRRRLKMTTTGNLIK